MNILLILADDYGAWALGCAGNTELKTPNIDRLAAQGLRFENCFCASPVCSPARVSLFTGRNPSQHGVHDWLARGHLDWDKAASDSLREKLEKNDEWYCAWPKSQLFGDTAIRYMDNLDSFPKKLAENGYECALSGKWHMGDSFNPQCGFSYWAPTAMGGENYYYPVVKENGKMVLKENCYITDLITDKALDFLHRRDAEKPFYLSVHYTAPHSPWAEQHHPKKYIDMYRDCPFNSTPNLPPHPWAPNGRKSLAQWNSEKHNGIRFSGAKYGPIPETWQEHRRESLTGYYAAITAMDAQIGRLLAYLDDNGLTDNTMIIFTGDNGMSMGHHGIWGKGNGTNPVNMYDSAVKVPCIVKYPGGVSGAVSQEMISHYDFYQTILDAVGIAQGEDASMPGHSFMPLILGGDGAARHGVVVFDEYGPCRMLRTRDWKLVLRIPDGPDELYDLKNDPAEMENLIFSPAHQELISQLKAELERWFARYVDPKFDGSKEAVCGRGQLSSHSFL